MKIQDKWVNVEAWKKVHPGGDVVLERFRNRDATDPFMALHSKEALTKVEKMKSVEPPKGYVDETKPVDRAFREFRAQLEKEGFFQHNWLWDFLYVAHTFVLCALGTYFAKTSSLLAIIFIGIGLQQAGWVGHDHSHQRGSVSAYLSRFMSLITAFSRKWWSNKHNTHHVHTNQKGVDSDIQNDPILHLKFPEKDKDFVLRPYQHIYYHLAYSLLYFSWRIQSLQYAYNSSEWIELFIMALNYTWLMSLPLPVAVGSILLGGWLVGEVVTATHQSEDMLDGPSFTFIEDQFKTTRDVHTDSYISNWLWGGMQYQLEHHLFPTMPRYYMSTVRPLVKKFAKENGLDYRSSPPMEIFKMNFVTMKKYAE